VKLLELYTSIQGEGPHTSEPTQFVRFAGCNLRCPGWPCDTQHAIQPSIWRTRAENLSALEVVDRVAPWPKHVCSTGGEPLLQQDVEMEEFIWTLLNTGYTVECFTNGTQLLPSWSINRVQFMMDWKLRGSGEDMSNFADTRLNNIGRMHARDGIKFVCKNTDDLHEAYKVWEQVHGLTPAKFWVGAVWGEITDQMIVDFIVESKLDWNLNVQVHKHIWHPDKQGV